MLSLYVNVRLFFANKSNAYETSEYADGNWIVSENLHINHLKDSSIIIYNINDSKNVTDIIGYRIINFPLEVDGFRKIGRKKEFYSGCIHFMECNNIINMQFASVQAMNDNKVLAKAIIKELSQYESIDSLYINGLTACKKYCDGEKIYYKIVEENAKNYKDNLKYLIQKMNE